MTVDPALLTAAIAASNKAIATALVYDPGTQAALQALDGKVLKINCTAPELSVYAVIEGGGLRLCSHYEQVAHCSLTGSAGALISLLWHDNHSLADSGVTVSGEPSLLSSMQQLLKRLDIDWQQPITDALGETAAFPLTRLLSNQSLWLRQRVQRLPDWLSDVLTEELQLLPSADELALFYQDVDDLRADSDRLEARINQLRKARSTTK